MHQSIDGRWAKSLDKPIEFRGYDLSQFQGIRFGFVEDRCEEARYPGVLNRFVVIVYLQE